MNTKHPASVACSLALMLITLAACDSAPAPTPPAQTASAAPPEHRVKTSCERVTAEQMSAILGAAVKAEAQSDSKCSYTPSGGGSMPMAELQIDMGSAEAAMTATGMLKQVEPEMTDPYEGMGDQAAAIGPAVWVRRGEDLVMITVLGADDHDAAVRGIYQLVDTGF